MAAGLGAYDRSTRRIAARNWDDGAAHREHFTLTVRGIATSDARETMAQQGPIGRHMPRCAPRDDPLTVVLDYARESKVTGRIGAPEG
jgi:hypothetical protein